LARIKGGTLTHKKHKAVLALAKGHWGQRHRIYKRAHESVTHALSYSFIHRREKKGDFRKLWISRINAAARADGLTYSQFMDMMKKSGNEINRKMLAELAVSDSAAFAALIAKKV